MNQQGTVTDSTVEINLGQPYNVVLFNDETHTMDEVVIQIIKATHYGKEQAVYIMLEAHIKGRAIVWTGHKERAEYISSVLEEIRLGTKVEPA